MRKNNFCRELRKSIKEAAVDVHEMRKLYSRLPSEETRWELKHAEHRYLALMMQLSDSDCPSDMMCVIK